MFLRHIMPCRRKPSVHPGISYCNTAAQELQDFDERRELFALHRILGPVGKVVRSFLPDLIFGFLHFRCLFIFVISFNICYFSSLAKKVLKIHHLFILCS